MPTASPLTRPGTASGRFYEADPARCREAARRLCRPFPDDGLPAILHGALVPHAGWICSGRVAGGTIATLAGHTRACTLVLTGTAHFFRLEGPVTDAADTWTSPLGEVAVDADLRDAVRRLDGFTCSDEAHRPEHSLEVQLPLMQTAFGHDVRIVPCLVPPDLAAPRWGERLGDLLASWPEPVAVIASSDLTHYGPDYGFTPMGEGPTARRWARDTNDRMVLDLIERMAGDEIVTTTRVHENACGGGAIAVTVAACRRLGATAGHVLAHTDSAREIGPRLGGRSVEANFVGYAGAVLG